MAAIVTTIEEVGRTHIDSESGLEGISHESPAASPPLATQSSDQYHRPIPLAPVVEAMPVIAVLVTMTKESSQAVVEAERL